MIPCLRRIRAGWPFEIQTSHGRPKEQDTAFSRQRGAQDADPPIVAYTRPRLGIGFGGHGTSAHLAISFPSFGKSRDGGGFWVLLCLAPEGSDLTICKVLWNRGVNRPRLMQGKMREPGCHNAPIFCALQQPLQPVYNVGPTRRTVVPRIATSVATRSSETRQLQSS